MSAGMGDVIAPELVWRGRLHLGDEPGIYGDASYVGLCVEFPLTLGRYEYAKHQPGIVTFLVEAQEVSIFGPYPGHKVTVWRYVPAGTVDNKTVWTRIPIHPERDYRMVESKAEVEIELPGDPEPLYLSVRIEVDTAFQPGVYDDFVLVELSMLSATFFSSFGFHYDSDANSSDSGSTST